MSDPKIGKWERHSLIGFKEHLIDRHESDGYYYAACGERIGTDPKVQERPNRICLRCERSLRRRMRFTGGAND